MATLETPTEGMARDFAAGQQIASGFMANYWRAKEGQLNEARYMAEQALRDVQLSVAQSQLETVRNAATVKAQQDAAIPGLFGLAAKAQANDWNPDTKLEFLEFLQKNPALARSQEAQNVLGMFNESDKIRRKIEAEQLKRQNAIDIAEIRANREAVDRTPKYVVNELGEPIEVTSGGAVRPIKAFTPVEQAEIESNIRILTKEVEESVGSKKVESQRKLDDYIKSTKELERKRNEDAATKLMPPEERKFAGWRAMIAGQDPNMVGNIPAGPPAVSTQTQPAPSTNAFKIRLKSP